MAFIPVDNVAKVEMLFFKGTVPVVNRFFFYRPIDWGGSEMLALATAVENAYLDAWKMYISDTINLSAIRVTDMRSETAPVLTKTVTGGAGGKIEQPLPLSDCLVVTLRTSWRGRTARGRVYLSGLTEDQWDGSQFASALKTAAENYISTIAFEAASENWQLGIVSFYSNYLPRSEGLFRPVSGWEVRSLKPGSQRRRDYRP